MHFWIFAIQFYINNNNNNIYSNYLQNKRFKNKEKTYRNVQDNIMQATPDEWMG